MLSQICTSANTDDDITVLVRYGNQSKPINITQQDDVSKIESKIYERFKFDTKQIKELQVQWYDPNFKEFIDLDNETWSKYMKNRQYERTNVGNSSQRHLKLVHKQWFRQEYHTQDTTPLSLNKPYTIIRRMAAHQTSGITEDRIGSQVAHMNQSIHTDWVLNGLGWLLPLIAVLAFLGDGIWLNHVYDPASKEQHNYAGLTSTILILFYYLQYDVKISSTHPKLYLFYQSLLLLCMLTGDILYASYYGHYIHDKFLMGVFIVYSILDSIFIVIIGYLKWYRQYRVSMGLSIHNLFHLMSRLEVLLIILIPIFTTYDVISTNSIAFFILYEFFSHSYNNPDLIYSGYSRLSFWLLIIFATVTVVCENFEFVYDHRAQDAHATHDTKAEEHNYKLALGFQYASNITELCAGTACYTLLILQFYSKSDKQRKRELENHEIEAE